MNEGNSRPKEITLGLIAGWVFGILLILYGLSNIGDNILISLISFGMAVAILPPCINYLQNSMNIKLSIGVKIVIIIAGFYFIGSLLENPDSRNNSLYNLEKRTQDYEPTYDQKGTLGQRNATSKAESYLRTMAFSKSGLIEQLKYDGFSEEDSRYAVNICNADWNDQAIKKAKSYLKSMAFSRDGLIEQLEYDGFTNSQARIGAKGAGY
jgi:hypothetical protein